MARFDKIVCVIFGVIQVVSLASIEQTDNGINEEVVGLIPPALIGAKIRNDAIQQHLRTIARANLIPHALHHPQMHLVPLFRDASEGNDFETNSLDSNTFRENVQSQDKIKNSEMFRTSTNENQAIMNDKPQMFRALTSEDSAMVQAMMNDNPQNFRAAAITTNIDPMARATVNDKSQMFRAMTNEESAMVQAMMNDNPQMFRATANSIHEDPTMAGTTMNDRPQTFGVWANMKNEDPTMTRTTMNDRPQTFGVWANMKNEDPTMTRTTTNDRPQTFGVWANMKNADPTMARTTMNNKPQMFRAMTNEESTMVQAMMNENPQTFRDMTNEDRSMIQAMISDNPQMFRADTNDDTIMIQSDGNSLFRVTMKDAPQKLRESTNLWQQLSRAKGNNGMVMILPNDSKMFRESENENPQTLHVMENPQSFRVMTNDDQGIVHAITNDNSQLFRALTDEDYFDMSDNGATFMEQLPDGFLNFQAINDENEFRIPSTVMLINTSNEDSQNSFRVVQKPVFQDTTITKIKTTPEFEKIVQTKPDGIVKPPIAPKGEIFEFVNPTPKPMPENQSSMMNETRSADEPALVPAKSNRPTLSITGTISDLQKAINRTLSKPVEARASTSDQNLSDFKSAYMYCITLSDKDLLLAQSTMNKQRTGSSEDNRPNLDANNASNHLLPDQLRSQTFIADADLVIPLDNNNLDEVDTKQLSDNPIQHTITPIRILSPPVNIHEPENNIEIRHIPHILPVHVISHGNNYGNQDYNRNSEARHIVKNQFITSEFISPSSSINNFQHSDPSFHRGFPSSQSFSQSSVSASSFQNGGGFHRGFIPSSGSSSSAFAQSSGVSHQPFFNGGFRSNDNSNIVNENLMKNVPNERNSDSGVQPAINAFRLVKMDNPNQDDHVVAVPNLLQVQPTHRLQKRSVSQNITSNSLIPIIKGIEDLFGDRNATKNLMEPLKEVENFLEKHTINEKIQLEKDTNGEPIIKTEFSTNFNPQELFTEFEEELPKVNRTKRTLALIHLLTRRSEALNNDLLGRAASSMEDTNLPPIIHLRNALGSAGRAAVNVVETPLLGFILPHSFSNEPTLGDSQNPNIHQRLNENRQRTMEHYQNTIQSLGNAVHAQRLRSAARQNNSPVLEDTEARDATIGAQMVPSQSTQNTVFDNVPASQGTHMIIRPIGRSWARMGVPTRRIFFIAEPFNPSQTTDESNLTSTDQITSNKAQPLFNPPIGTRKPNKKFKKVLHRQPTKFEPNNSSKVKNLVVGSNFEGKSAESSNSSKDGSNVNEPSEGTLSAINPDTTPNDTTDTIVTATNESEKSSDLTDINDGSLITISQCKEMQENGDIKVKREETRDINDETDNSETVGTTEFTEFMKKPFGGLATPEQINNYLSNTNQD